MITLILYTFFIQNKLIKTRLERYNLYKYYILDLKIFWKQNVFIIII